MDINIIVQFDGDIKENNQGDTLNQLYLKGNNQWNTQNQTYNRHGFYSIK